MVWKGDSRGRLAKSLITLIDQVDAMWPNRDRTSDGSIGDAAHQARTSDHNINAAGVVTALDIDRDISARINSRKLVEMLVASRDPRIEYIISDGQIISSRVSPWVWRTYTGGSNPHREHAHISVHDESALYDDPRPWAIFEQPARPGMFTGITATVFGGPDDGMSGNQTAYGNLIADGWWNRPGVALPARFTQRPLPHVRVTYNGKQVICPVIDVGPWNINDPYWETGSRPQAESGRDMTPRKRFTNKAGIDLTPAAAREIGLPGKGIVDWEFVTPVDGDVLDPLPKPPPAQPAEAGLLLPLLLIMLLTKETPMTNETTGASARPDMTTVLLQALLQSALTGKPLDSNELLRILLQGMLGIPALPPPATSPDAPAPQPQTQQPQNLNDLFASILLQLAAGKQQAAPANPPPVEKPAEPAPAPVVTTPAIDPVDKGSSVLGFVMMALAAIGQMTGLAPTVGESVNAALPAITGPTLLTAGGITGLGGLMGAISPLIGPLLGFITRGMGRK